MAAGRRSSGKGASEGASALIDRAVLTSVLYIDPKPLDADPLQLLPSSLRKPPPTHLNTRRLEKNVSKLALTGRCFLLTWLAVSRVGGAEQPNILFIMVDDLGPEWVSSYGAELIETPNIDRLAREGMRFENAYSMPQCTPTRVCLLTGQYPFRNGWINHWDVPRWGDGCHFDPKQNPSFARLLRKAGYATCAAGKWQISDFRVEPRAMVESGFDEYCMWTGYETGNPPSHKRYWDPYLHTKDGSRTYPGEFSEEIFTDFIIDFMKRNRERPFLVYYPMCLTHGPLTTTPLAPNVTGKMEQFKAMVTYTDHILGKLVQALETLDVRKKTIIFWTTDNGTSRGIEGRMHGRTVRGGKGTPGENGCREPFIANCPGIVPKGVVTDALTDFTDMLPTFAELSGAARPTGVTLDGVSIAPLITGRAIDSPRTWIMAMGGGAGKYDRETERVVPVFEYRDRVIRDKRYKLWIDTNRKSVKLFDLKNDPAEMKNLIDSTDAAVVAARKSLEAVAARFPEVDGHPRYDPTPAQRWDRRNKQIQNTKRRQPRKKNRRQSTRAGK